jgi:hypothetical protein
VQVLLDREQLREEVGGHLPDLETQEVLHLRERDDDRNAVGEADHDRHRHEADHLPELEEAHRHQQQAGHHGGDQQVRNAVALDDGIEQGDERPRRARDLYPRAAQGGDDETTHDRRDQALLRLDAGGDAERHRQRHRDTGDRETGAEVGSKIGAPVALDRFLQRRPEPEVHRRAG